MELELVERSTVRGPASHGPAPCGETLHPPKRNPAAFTQPVSRPHMFRFCSINYILGDKGECKNPTVVQIEFSGCCVLSWKFFDDFIFGFPVEYSKTTFSKERDFSDRLARSNCRIYYLRRTLCPWKIWQIYPALSVKKST